MVVLSQPALDLDHCSLLSTCNIPEIDLSHPDAKSHIVKACEEFGFFKLIDHKIPLNLMTKLEQEALCFFNLSQSEKNKSLAPNPLGYGSKNIGPNGDLGWIEYLLLNANPLPPISPGNYQSLLAAVNEYVPAVKKLGSEIVELITEGLNVKTRDVVSRLMNDESSDSCFRVNHYPARPEHEEEPNLLGFGEHTDPQIISLLRSNDAAGLQIRLRDGAWVSLPADEAAFFVNVGDALQVMSNGRFRSVVHRVVAEAATERVSMIYFAGPPPSERIVPLPELLGDGEESLYKEFTWWEYKTAAYKTRLADNRLGLFEK